MTTGVLAASASLGPWAEASSFVTAPMVQTSSGALVPADPAPVVAGGMSGLGTGDVASQLAILKRMVQLLSKIEQGQGAHASTGAAMPTMSKSMHHMVVPRTAPDNPARAQRIYDALFAAFGGLRRSQVVQHDVHGQHYALTPAQQHRFAKANPGMPVPKRVMFPKGRNPNDRVVSAVFASRAKHIDLGLGPNHRHHGQHRVMQHVYFSGRDDLPLAFGDIAVQKQALHLATQRQQQAAR